MTETESDSLTTISSSDSDFEINKLLVNIEDSDTDPTFTEAIPMDEIIKTKKVKIKIPDDQKENLSNPEIKKKYMKDYMKEYQTKRRLCECGKEVSNSGYYKHLKSNAHLKKLNKLDDVPEIKIEVDKNGNNIKELLDRMDRITKLLEEKNK